MGTLEKIRKLTDKKHGIGISMTIISKYLNCHPSTITYYLNGAIPKEEVIVRYEEGLQELYKDIQEILDKGE